MWFPFVGAQRAIGSEVEHLGRLGQWHCVGVEEGSASPYLHHPSPLSLRTGIGGLWEICREGALTVLLESPFPLALPLLPPTRYHLYSQPGFYVSLGERVCSIRMQGRKLSCQRHTCLYVLLHEMTGPVVCRFEHSEQRFRVKPQCQTCS